MPRLKTGSVRERNGKLYARISYLDKFGKQKFLERRAENITEAKNLIKELIEDFEQKGERAIEGRNLTFGDLAEYYKKHYLVEAVYVNQVKVAGVRQPSKYDTLLGVLKSYFGHRRLREITNGDMQTFKVHRLSTPTKQKTGQRAIASVNRELALARRMFEIAYREGWINRNPCIGSTPLISMAAEVKRRRVCSPEEEKALLAQCEGPRAHLKAIIITLIDTGMRRREWTTLQWDDVQWEENRILIRSMNTKTQNSRFVPITKRMKPLLEELKKKNGARPDRRVFGILDDIKKAFYRVCTDAKVYDLRPHDFRHTFITRLSQAGMPLSQISLLAGHATPQITMRYVNQDFTSVSEATELINKFNAQSSANPP